MKILVVGDGHSAIHEVAVFEAFQKLGHQVEAFYWHTYFNSQNPLVRLWQRIQNKFIIGPTLGGLNADLINAAVQFIPKLIFIYRGTHITPQTVTEIKQRLPDCVVYGYNNDDPFADGHPPWLWRHFLKSVPKYDLVFAYRKHNIQEYYAYGAKRVELLMPWFIKEKDKQKIQDQLNINKYDVIFVGHYERDDRIDYLRKIGKSHFIFGLFGPDWDRAPKFDWLSKYQPVLPVRGHLYSETIRSANIALSFLSKLNRDTYTRRCFEIPAMGVFMLCQYSDDLACLFEDGIDAVFFHNPDDMMEKIEYYTQHDKLREKIATSGMNRVIRDKHDVISRMDYVQSFIEEAMGQK
ncbi:glycosyltransferase [Burkholderiales bacterium]|nr:glycosyltransferase [Burkholderiales bacterium]